MFAICKDLAKVKPAMPPPMMRRGNWIGFELLFKEEIERSFEKEEVGRKML